MTCRTFWCLTVWFVWACLFQRKSQAIMIARSSLPLSLRKNFNVAYYSKSYKGINIKLGIHAHHDKVQLQDKGHNYGMYILGVMPLFNWILFYQTPDQIKKAWLIWTNSPSQGCSWFRINNLRLTSPSNSRKEKHNFAGRDIIRGRE